MKIVNAYPPNYAAIKARARAKAHHAANRDTKIIQMRQRYRTRTPEQKAEEAKRSRAWRANNGDAVRAINLKHKYGITPGDFTRLAEAQAWCCAICETPHDEVKRGLAVDRDHETDEVRGLLCHNCNMAIGLLQDDPDIMVRAAAYLRRKIYMPMEMKPVERSANVQAVGYDPKTETLRIQFASGTYEYTTVPQGIYDGLMKSPSKGGYVHTAIKGKFPTQRLDSSKPAA